MWLRVYWRLFMNFIPNKHFKEEMLKEIGLRFIDELFSDIPEKIKIKELNLPKGLSQLETERKLRRIASKNRSLDDFLSFAGGGFKPHFIPAAVKAVISRSEFFTSYTPYQSEASQGFLQAMFEYQSLICELTGMEVANASLYDGATALGEAALMCKRVKKDRGKFVIPACLSWDKKSVLQNYVKGIKLDVKQVSYDSVTGKINIEELKNVVDKDTVGVYVENPNFFGVFEDQVDEISEVVRDVDSLFVVGVDPLSLGVIKKPVDYGADIVIGEGKCLGNPLDYGGSTLGVFATHKKFLRATPGRIIGMTHDVDGKRAFCMAFQTREQHIRRGKATSNICTNEGLCALSAAVYLAWLGGDGLREIAVENFRKSQELSRRIESIDGFEKRFKTVHFNEFVIKSKHDLMMIYEKMLRKKVQIGLPLQGFFSDLKNCMLVGITEAYTDEEIDFYINSLTEVVENV